MTARYRIGIGYDVHRLGGSRPLVLGGVEIPDHPGLEGHSDADVLTHAITDALLGAAALGDLGRHFPDDDPRYRDAESVELLSHVAGLLRESGWRVVNTDATVVCESPRLAPFIERMKDRLATGLGIESPAVSVKATTNEQMGFIGRGEGIAAVAVVMIDRDSTEDGT